VEPGLERFHKMVYPILSPGLKPANLLPTFTALAQASAPIPKGMGFHLLQATTTRETL
jgi:hypothetical protein